jgi:hypothetical protein
VILAGSSSRPIIRRSVLEMNPTYWVVEKREGVPAEVARERDPRG